MLSLKGIKYQWIVPQKHGNLTGNYMGMIAQDVEKVEPEWVGTDKNGYKTLGFIGFEALSVESFRELNKHIDELKKDNQELRERVQDLEQGR